MITMMYETESGSGEYTETKDTTWPESGYIFNDSLSGCENGGELEYNSGNNTVNLLSNSSDKCYVYFDKYDGVWIDNVTITNVTGSSITLDVSATSENGSITNYYYSLNDSEYVSSITNPITINNLNKLTEYKISIYVIDNTNAKSNIYELTVTTTDESRPTINSVIASNITYSSITLTVNATSESEIKRYYYSIDGGNTYYTANNTYTFEHLKNGTTYNFLVYVVDNNKNESNEYNINFSTEKGTTIVDFVKNKYITDGTNNLYYHDGQGTYTNADQEADDNSYRYSGANPNNYVCFGSTISVCPSENLYRIIGVFDNRAKLIKSTSYGTYAWDSNNNNWSSSTVKVLLNEVYLNELDSMWSDLIAITNWSVGDGVIFSQNTTVKQYYDAEVKNSSVVDSSKIGLMYISDYAYAAEPRYWTTGVYRYTGSTDWLHLGSSEWTISKGFMIRGSGYVTNGLGTSPIDDTYGIRPVFYLDSEVLYESGNGTEQNPIRLVV